MAGIVAVVTFGFRRLVKFGFTDCAHVVMAVAAVAKYFQVIYERGDGKTLGGMTGLA